MPRKPPRKIAEKDGKFYSPRGKELTRNLNTQTQSEHMGCIRSALRSASRYWKPAMKCLENASRPYVGADKRKKKEYQCANCKQWCIRSKVEVNHIFECGTLRDYEDVPEFLTRLFCEDVNGYEVLCKECHKVETNRQRGL